MDGSRSVDSAAGRVTGLATMTRPPARVDAVIVGAGQAGLTMSWHLRQAGRDHVLLDRRATLGGGWQDRWDRFRLVSPNWTASFPGAPYDGSDPDGYMPRDEIASRVAALRRGDRRARRAGDRRRTVARRRRRIRARDEPWSGACPRGDRRDRWLPRPAHPAGRPNHGCQGAQPALGRLPARDRPAARGGPRGRVGSDRGAARRRAARGRAGGVSQRRRRGPRATPLPRARHLLLAVPACRTRGGPGHAVAECRDACPIRGDAWPATRICQVTTAATTRICARSPSPARPSSAV